MWLSKRDAARERKQRDVMRDSYHYSDLGLLMMKGDTPRCVNQSRTHLK